METIDCETSSTTTQPGWPRPHTRPRQTDNGDTKNRSLSPIQQQSSTGTMGHGQPPNRRRSTPSLLYILLKTLTDGACLVSAGRLFHSFAPRYEKLKYNSN